MDLDLAFLASDRRLFWSTAFTFCPFCVTELVVAEFLIVFLTTVVLKIVVIFVLI